MTRPYRGSAPEARHAERRARLINAGVELVGTGGVAALTMRAVCRQAQLSQKFFYESFTDTEDLLREVYRTTFQRTLAIVDAAATQATSHNSRIRASVDAAAKLVTDDPRVCRILLVEPVANLGLRHFVRNTIAGMISFTVGPPDDSAQSKMHYATLFGAIISLFLEWTEGNLGDDRTAFVDHVTATVLASPLASAAAEPRP
ncbi:TetR/AcrR family transcriptional regulator [[Mycobacterium] nativiensis]|uniref:TetR/AcrR family transcriptional regulator n=1 Tax=[Mycobacterium] nativiensis TaxID=2855503 RepID=A0ABU5XVA5_9MYCO|nr:TetR/AcrR family transcriptional regulator [Mycolicibacter sp. MYC340]MEB3031870.1 TetR/AcrR family transcriptional regulator [Mycolicibacter sp. MYC340]